MIASGALATDFKLADLDGQSRTLSELLEKGPVLLFFLKQGCGATDVAAPFVERIHRGYQEHESAEGTRLTVIGISQEDLAATERFRQRHGLDFSLLLDEDLVASRAFDLEATPTLVLLKGAERLRADARRVPASEAMRVMAVVEGWSRSATEQLSDEVAARIGTIPVELFSAEDSAPAALPG